MVFTFAKLSTDRDSLSENNLLCVTSDETDRANFTIGVNYPILKGLELMNLYIYLCNALEYEHMQSGSGQIFYFAFRVQLSYLFSPLHLLARVHFLKTNANCEF